MAIDTSNISFINYLWTKKNGDGTLTGIRLSKDNLPEYLADPIPILAGKNISITPTNAGIEISAAADGKVKTVNNISPDENGNVTVPIPTALKNPNALTFGSKTYDGSSAKTITASDLGALTSHQDISGKQDTLVSGTNIKTINGNNILGSGDLTISGGGGSTVTVDAVSQDNLSFLRFTIS